MEKNKENAKVSKMRNRNIYKLVVVNEDTMKEAFRMKLTRKKVFILLASLFMTLFILFSLLIFFTPLKYYIPGNNSGDISRHKLIQMQHMADSLQKMNEIQEKFILNIMNVANGTVSKPIDTSILNYNTVKQAEIQNANKIDRASRYEYLKNQKPDTNVDNSVQKKDSVK